MALNSFLWKHTQKANRLGLSHVSHLYLTINMAAKSNHMGIRNVRAMPTQMAVESQFENWVLYDNQKQGTVVHFFALSLQTTVL